MIDGSNLARLRIAVGDDEIKPVGIHERQSLADKEGTRLQFLLEVGALIGALYLASRRSVLGLGRAIVFSTFAFGVGLIGFAFSTTLWLSLMLMLVTGFGMMVQMAASNTILQTIVEEDKRGRVMSLFSMAFLGMMPFGSLFAGVLAGWIGAANTVMIGGVSCLVGGALFAMVLPRLRLMVRPIYARMGILPDEDAVGMESAAELPRSH